MDFGNHLIANVNDRECAFRNSSVASTFWIEINVKNTEQ